MKISTKFAYRIHNPATNLTLTGPAAMGTPGAVLGNFFNPSVPTIQELSQCWVISASAAQNGRSSIQDARTDSILLSNSDGVGDACQVGPAGPSIAQYWDTETSTDGGAVRIFNTNSDGERRYLTLGQTGVGTAVTCEVDTAGQSQVWELEPLVTVPFTTAAMAATYVSWREEVVSQDGLPIEFGGNTFSYVNLLEMFKSLVLGAPPPRPAGLLDSVEYWLIHYDGATGNSAPAYAANQAIINAGEKIIGVPAPDWQEVGGILEPSSEFGGEDAR